MKDYDSISKELNDEIKGKLNPKRYRHTLNVLEKTLELAEKYETDKNKAAIAALAHDLFRGTDDEKKDALTHGPRAAEHIRKKYNIEDDDIIDAVRYHTTGRKNMCLNEKIVFLADAIEKDRDYDGVDDIRKAAETGLDEGIRESLLNTVRHLENNNKNIDENTIEALKYMDDLLSSRCVQ